MYIIIEIEKLNYNSIKTRIIKIVVARGPLMALLIKVIYFFFYYFVIYVMRSDVVEPKKWNREQKSEVSIKKSAEY